MKLIDLSHEIYNGMPVYPGDTETDLRQIKYLDADGYNNHKLDICLHSGTHIDSPMHLIASQQYISQLPLESFIAEGCVLDVRNQAIIKMKPEYDSLVKENSIVLLYTGFDKYYGIKEYYEDHPCIDMELCRFLIDKKVKMVGMDTPSPDRYPFEIHKLFFTNNIYILENLTNLDKLLNAGKIEVMAFPLRIRADSSITRAVARIL
ncbi:MAG TPA: cyclase family protein [Clostridia bacterium]|nr:cyclase family protein [Clostridia bacterium]